MRKLNHLNLRAFALLCVAIGASSSVYATLNVGSDGSDGAVNQQHKTFNMAEAYTGPWNTPSPNPGKGVYDPTLWAVVYKFSSYTTWGDVVFQPHPSGCPVVILVQDEFTMNGNLFINGGNQAGASISIPGPGGFRGGSTYASATIQGGAGFGPGGGDYTIATSEGAGGSHATKGGGLSGPSYGNETCIPLVGGSGGAGGSFGSNGRGGAAGGGAILIAAGNTLKIGGTIHAYGGHADNWGGAGAGGTVRLVGDRVEATGIIWAYGGQSPYSGKNGGNGRIRIESNTRLLTGTFNPLASVTASVPATPQLWPTSTQPALRISAVDAINAPLDPRANLFDPDIPLTTSGNKAVTVIANNIPTDGSWIVQVRLTPRYGEASFVNCSFVSGNQASSTWTGTLNFDGNAGALIARAFVGP